MKTGLLPSWDGGATEVFIELPDSKNYDPDTAVIIIRDNGHGMSDEQVDSMYLVIGRNRRLEGPPESGRPPMGRKGIGKLAGFGMAREVEVRTWRDGKLTLFTMRASELTTSPGNTKQTEIAGSIHPVPSGFGVHGTEVILRSLKHSTPLNPESLGFSLARRFGRSVRGVMTVHVDGDAIPSPYESFDFEFREPDQDYKTVRLDDGNDVKYFFGTSKKSLGSSDLRGFSILVRGKVAQAPPFFFNVEATASGQHGTRYLVGEIEADFLDDSNNNEDDIITTDRQEIDWSADRAQALKEWGEELTRRALREWRDRQGNKAEKQLDSDPELKRRLTRLDPRSKASAIKSIRLLGENAAEIEKMKSLASGILTAYEYQNFHDFVDELESLSETPDKLEDVVQRFVEWRVLESRAILEVIRGRVEVVEKFHQMIVNDYPETASKNQVENMHDLLAEFPWLIDPEWQILEEEKSVTKQLREWNLADGIKSRERFDFLALSHPGNLVVIEIKRAGHSVEFDEFQRLQSYRERLARAHDTVSGLMIGSQFSFLTETYQNPVFTFKKWSELKERASFFYNHYKAILEADVDDPDFQRKAKEVARTRSVLETTIHRPKEVREQQGLGSQDADFGEFKPSTLGENPKNSDGQG